MTESKGIIIVESAEAPSAPSIVNQNLNTVKFEAELQEADAPNRNNRIYEKSAIDDALQYYTVKEKLKHKTFYGEAAHPLSTDVKRQMYIDQRNISHIVTDYRWDGNHLIGMVETAATEAGKDMAGLIRQGSDVAFSMRGVGNVTVKDGNFTRIKSPLYIVSYDWVIVPSHPNSYMTHLVNESASPVSGRVALNEAAEIQNLVSAGVDISGKNRALFESVNMEELLDFVTRKSENVHALTESLGFDMNEASDIHLEDANSTLSLTRQNETLKIYLEDNIKRSADDFFAKMF